MLKLTELRQPIVQKEVGRVWVSMGYTRDGTPGRFEQWVEAISDGWACVQAACIVAEFDPRLVFGPFVTETAGGQSHHARVEISGREYTASGTGGRLWTMVEAIFAAASEPEVEGETAPLTLNVDALLELEEQDAETQAVPTAEEPIVYQCAGGEARIGCSTYDRE